MKKILFTRSIDAAYKKTLQSAGFDILEYDFFKIDTLPTATNDILKEIPHFKNLVFTSQHAVRIFFESFETLNVQQQLDAGYGDIFKTCNIFSTSGATKDLIEKYNFSPTLSADSAKQLAHLMLENIDLQDGVHFICGTISLPFLPDILSENGVLIKKITVYDTVMTPLSISEHFDALAFLSLSAADSFLQKNKLNPDTPVFTLGKTTADYVHKMTSAKTIFAVEKPTIAALIDLILKKCT